jgi:hypothetical protein
MKIMLMTVSGGTETFRIGPLKTIVAVTDSEHSFIANMRNTFRERLLKEELLQDASVAVVNEVVRALHITLTDSGLTEWPEGLGEVESLYQRMAHGTENNAGVGEHVQA